MDTAKLLGEYANLVYQYGPNSKEANQFLEEHKGNKDFVELAKKRSPLRSAIISHSHPGLSKTLGIKEEDDLEQKAGFMSQFLDRRQVTHVGLEMVKAFARDVDNYLPIFQHRRMLEEGGVSENSYRNLCYLIERLGKPTKVMRRANGNVLVHFSADNYYLATGFEVSYFGSGPHYFARFGEKAGFGECDGLYMKLADTPRDFVGVIWEQKS